MRVISGKYRGRKLNTPENYDIRPTTDKAKEALFSILSEEISGQRILDLFAGTGGLGIEALSRGAEYCLFADSSAKSLNLIKENLQHCKIEGKNRIMAGDYKKTLKNLSDRIADGLEKQFDIIFLDPPYNNNLLDDAFRLIDEGNILSHEGVIIAEHRKQEILPETFYRFKKNKEKRYGVVILSFYNNM